MWFLFWPLGRLEFRYAWIKRPNFNNFATKRTQCINNAFHILSLPAYINFDIKVPNRTNMRYLCIRVYKQMHEVSSWINLAGHCGSQLNFNRRSKLKGTDSSRYSTKIGTKTHEQQMNRVIVHPSPAHHITLFFFPGFQLTTDKKGRFLHVFDRSWSQLAPGRLPGWSI